MSVESPSRTRVSGSSIDDPANGREHALAFAAHRPAASGKEKVDESQKLALTSAPTNTDLGATRCAQEPFRGDAGLNG
jgi:hypothetical protein